MSSVYSRTQIKNFLTLKFPSEKFIDLSALFDNLPDMISDAGLQNVDPWVGLQFVGNDEMPVTVGATNTKGKYMEDGAVYIHIVDIAKLGVSDSILARAESIRNALRGQRLGGLVIESVSPPNFGTGATLNFEGGYMSATFICSYSRDFDI